MKSLKEIASKSIDSNAKTELLYHAIEEWIIDEFAPEIQKWVIEEFATEIQGWIIKEFSPQIEKWVKDYVMDNHTVLHIEDFCGNDSVDDEEELAIIEKQKKDKEEKKIKLIRTGEDYSDMGAPHKVETYNKSITIRELIDFALESDDGIYGGKIFIGPWLNEGLPNKGKYIEIPYKHQSLCGAIIPDEILDCVIKKCSAFGSWGGMDYFIDEFEMNEKAEKLFKKLAKLQK